MGKPSPGMGHVFEKRLGLWSETDDLAECRQLKVVELKGWSAGATNERVMNFSIPCWSLGKNTAIVGKRCDIQSKERTEPHIGRHSVLRPVTSIQVRAQDCQLDVTVVMKLKNLVQVTNQ